jgi:hypothetical protein
VSTFYQGGSGSIPRRCSSIFGIWREVLGRNVYITSQYFFPAIIYRDIISHITITYRYIMYFFRTFKKSTAPYKVHNMGLRYIKYQTYLYTEMIDYLPADGTGELTYPYTEMIDDLPADGTGEITYLQMGKES